MNSSIDQVASQQQEELQRLKGRKRGYVYLTLVGFCFFSVFSLIFASLPSATRGRESVERARLELINSTQSWGKELSSAQREYYNWLLVYGLAIEHRLFDYASQITFLSAAKVGANSDLSLFSRGWIGLHFAFLRVVFVLVACWRIWMVGIIAAMIFRYRRWKVHSGDDLLGQMGTGQIFYSGLRAGIERVNEQGAPEMQVTGLACPMLSSEAEAQLSDLGKKIKRWGVANQTNLGLVRVIQYHRDWPAYIPATEEEGVFSKYFAGAKLAEHATLVLEACLELHAYYQTESIDSDPDFFTAHYEGSEVADEKVSSGEYAWILQRSIHRVLTPKMRHALTELTTHEFATIILSHFSGKAMAYGFQGGRWIQRSNFPELCARSILHSIPALSEEYNFNSRAIIRRALIYSSRKSAFAPVRFPVDLSPATRAARHCVELLMASPHELQSTADEVELIGRIHEIYTAWTERFFAGALVNDPEIVGGAYSTMSNLFLVPLENLVRVARAITEPQIFRRIEDLTLLVSQKQRLQTLAIDSGDTQGERGALHNQGRVFPPLSAQEIRELSELHGVQADVLKDWITVRAVLSQYSWLARRVGDYSVPESSLIFAVLKFGERTAETNELGLVGKSGMVALRGSRIEAKCGRNWQSRFAFATGATMSETREDFEKLMRGIEESAPEDPFSTTFAIG